MKLKGGVIIIGSLFWQNDLDFNSGDNVRKDWRENSLDFQNKILTKLPIRYGRYSDGNIYTMVFSTNCEKTKKLGTGYIISLNLKLNPFDNINTIICEAKKMSKAEGMGGKFNNSWSSMGIILNKNELNKEPKETLLKKWQEKFKSDCGGKDLNEYQIGSEKRCISPKGELQIKWPKAVNPEDNEKINEFDFLFAASTKPEHKDSKQNKYPTDSEILESVRYDNKRFYFKNNRSCNITTHQDIKIIDIIN